MKIIEGVSHLDHHLTQAQREHIATVFADRHEFFLETIELPPELGTVPCSLRGPAVEGAPVPEGAVRYMVRGPRKYASRVIDLAPAPYLDLSLPSQVRTVTVIAGPAGPEDGLPFAAACVLYTAYGGPGAPREPGDPAISSWEELVASRAFWSEHALLV